MGFSIVFDSGKAGYNSPQNHDDTLLEKVNLNGFTMDLALNETITLK